MTTAQKYVLDSNDVILSSLLTTSNKNNLVAGGLFKALIATDNSSVNSGNFESRKLFNSSGTATISWDSNTLENNWNVGGNLTVSGDISANTISGDFSGTFDLSSVSDTTVRDLLALATTDDLDEGDSNYYYTDTKVKDKVNAMLSVSAPLTGELVDESYNLGFSGISGMVETDNTIHVNVISGTDTRTDLTNYDFSYPFATIRAAKEAAVSGDTIIVWPGTYNDEYDILKDGVDFFFFPGSKVVQTPALDVGTIIMRDSGGLTSNVYGHGTFITNNNLNRSVIKLTDASSKVKVQANLIQTTTATVSENVITHNAGNLEVESRKIISSGSGIRTTDDIIIVKNSYVKSELGCAICIRGQSVNAFIDNCQLETACDSAECGAIFVYPNSTGCRIKNNILIAAGDHSIVTEESDTCIISVLAGNTANKSIMTGVTTEELAPFTIDENFQLTIF